MSFFLFPSVFSISLYIYIYVCRFRRAPHRWLSTFFMPINQRVSNSTQRQQQLTHQQKVSYRMPIVSISRSLASLFRTCLYWRDQFLLSFFLSPLAPRRSPFSLYSVDPSSSTYTAVPSLSLPVVRWSELSVGINQLAILCNCDDLTDAATFFGKMQFSISTHTSCLQ